MYKVCENYKLLENHTPCHLSVSSHFHNHQQQWGFVMSGVMRGDPTHQTSSQAFTLVSVVRYIGSSPFHMRHLFLHLQFCVKQDLKPHLHAQAGLY